MANNNPDVGIPAFPKLLTAALVVFIGYLYVTDYKDAIEPKPQTGKVTYLLAEDDVKEIEFIDGKTKLKLDKDKVDQLSKHLDEAFAQEVEVFEVELDKYEPGNAIPEEKASN